MDLLLVTLEDLPVPFFVTQALLILLVLTLLFVAQALLLLLVLTLLSALPLSLSRFPLTFLSLSRHFTLGSGRFVLYPGPGRFSKNEGAGYEKRRVTVFFNGFFESLEKNRCGAFFFFPVFFSLESGARCGACCVGARRRGGTCGREEEERR